MKSSLRLIALCLTLTTFAAAETLTGTVKNGTTGKSAAGDEVVLLNLMQGMEETARTKTDSKGNFSFNLPEAGAPHLIRVIHQGVTYHRMAPPGTTSVEAEVFDVAKKVDGIGVTADVMRLQAEGNTLQGIRLFAVNNTSSPPRTQMSDQNFQFYLPEGAQVDVSQAKTAGGQPVISAPVPQKEKNRYALIFPLRPGETQFQISFHLPYSGEASINPKSLYATDHFVVMLPKTMQFSPGPGTTFQSMQDPSQSDAVVQVATRTQPGQSLAFKISGTGTLQTEAEPAGEAQAGGATMSRGRDSRPGGGLGPPIDAPDPLEKYRWYILGGFAAVLAAGAFYITTRKPTVPVAGPSGAMEEPYVPAAPRQARPAASGRSGLLMDALKEELFQLEVERQQGRISQQEYEKAKAALDQTLQRAVKREAQKP